MKPAVIYTRVSTSKQADDGVSLDAQRDRALAYCAFNNFEVIATLEDSGISGSKMHTRPALLRAIEVVCKAKGVLVVYSLSRMARSTQDAMAIMDKLNKAGADIVSLTEQFDTTSAAGKMLFRILSVFAEFERDLCSDRTKSALAYKRNAGEKTGGTVPYGFDKIFNSEGVQVLNINEIEAANIQAMMSFRDGEEPKSFWWISKELNSLGVPSKTGKAWSAGVVREVIMQEKKRRSA